MAGPTEAERYIHFQLAQLKARNEHHAFEDICSRVAERRLSSNIQLASGPVSAGGDQGRDAETYYTSLPAELPRAGGFVGRASTEPLVVACTTQAGSISSKVKSDLKSISAGRDVARVAFFTIDGVPTKTVHTLQKYAQKTYGINLEIFDGLQIARMLAASDLVWVAQRYLELPSNLVPDPVDEPQPDWYIHTLAALRDRAGPRLTPGALSEVRDGLRHAVAVDDARVDLPEWLRYIREFIRDDVSPELVARARYEYVLATVRGTNSVSGVEDDIRGVIRYALETDHPPALSDASVLLLFWGGTWLRRLGTVEAAELRDLNLRLRDRVRELLAATEPATYPIRAATLLDAAAYLALHPRWTEVDRPPTGSLASPQDTTRHTAALIAVGQLPIMAANGALLDVTGAMDYLTRLVALLPDARVFPVGGVAQYFQMLAPALVIDPRYAEVRDALDRATAATSGDSAAAERCRDRAVAFLAAGQPLIALAELHTAKINWWYGDTLRGSLLAMRMIARIYSELHLQLAAKQYALTAATVAMTSDLPDLQDLVPAAIFEASGYTYRAGNWADAAGLAAVGLLAHSGLAEDAFDFVRHKELKRLDIHVGTTLLAAKRFRPPLLPILDNALATYAGDHFAGFVDLLESSFTFTETEFVDKVHEQLGVRPFTDVGRRRTIRFAAAGITWTVTTANNRPTVLAAERFAAALQILLVELLTGDPVFVPQDVQIEILTGTPLAGRDRIRFAPNNDGIDATVILSAVTDPVDAQRLAVELEEVLLVLLASLSAMVPDQFVQVAEKAIINGLHHKLHLGRPYDELAALLPDTHYNPFAAIAIEPLGDDTYPPHEAAPLSAPRTPGPGYDREKALANIYDNYNELPTVFAYTLARALADDTTRTGFAQLRADGWLDWHLLIAIHNVIMNQRMRDGGIDWRTTADAARRRELMLRTESETSTPVALDTLTPQSLQAMMDTSILAIGQRRWGLSAPTRTPNSRAFTKLLADRYGFTTDDVPHLDLLHEALDANGVLLPLV